MRDENRVLKPKVVLAMIVQDGKFLLIRRKVRLLKLEWAFPGGVIEDEETDEQAVVRETREEVGLQVEVRRKVLERKHPDTFVEVAYFYCIPKGKQTPKIGEPYEIAEIAWVPAEEVLTKFTSDVAPEIHKFILSRGN